MRRRPTAKRCPTNPLSPLSQAHASVNYRVFARIPTPRLTLAEVTDGLTTVVTAADRSTVAVWALSGKSATAALQVGRRASALAVSANGRRVLTGNTDGEVAAWDAAARRAVRLGGEGADRGRDRPGRAAHRRRRDRRAIVGLGLGRLTRPANSVAMFFLGEHPGRADVLRSTAQ